MIQPLSAENTAAAIYASRQSAQSVQHENSSRAMQSQVTDPEPEVTRDPWHRLNPTAPLAPEEQVKEDASETRASRLQFAKTGGDDFAEAEKVMVRELKARDQEVRKHEQAHMAAGAGHVVQGAHYTYQQGPNGHRYAVGGEVKIDISPVPGDPEATINKAEAIAKAALAPANPSAQDRRVAARAMQMKTAARAEQLQVQPEEGSRLSRSWDKGPEAKKEPDSRRLDVFA